MGHGTISDSWHGGTRTTWRAHENRLNERSSNFLGVSIPNNKETKFQALFFRPSFLLYISLDASYSNSYVNKESGAK
jgi:hypothetical protein